MIGCQFLQQYERAFYYVLVSFTKQEYIEDLFPSLEVLSICVLSNHVASFQ